MFNSPMSNEVHSLFFKAEASYVYILVIGINVNSSKRDSD